MATTTSSSVATTASVPEKVADVASTQLATPNASAAVVAPVGSAASAADPASATPAVNTTGAAPAPTTGAPASPAAASLYVGDLDDSVTEAQLFGIFNNIGAVASIRVCRDSVTRRSLGYAYVNYHSTADAEKAIETLNYQPIKDRPMRIMWSQRDPSTRKTNDHNIFIKNLDPSIDTRALHDTFSAFGNILSCKVAVDAEGKSRGFGFVHFEDAEAADLAIKNVDGMLLNDLKVYVGYHISNKERRNIIDEQRSKFTNVYVKNVDESVDDATLNELFTKYGPITSAVVSLDDNGKSRGFGFVNFENHEDAEKAVEALHETELKGKTLYVQRAQKKTEREETLRREYERQREEKNSQYLGVNLYVKNLDDSINDEKLRQEFAPYGTITSAKVMFDEKTNQSRGFGFVCFSTPDEATKAVTIMNGRMIGNKPIYVAPAQRKEQRRQQLSAQMMQMRNQMRMQQVIAPPGAYPGAPVFFPGGMPAQRPPNMFYNPMVRPRWPGPQPNQPGQPAMQPYPNAQHPYLPGQPGMRQPPRPRPAGRNQQFQAGQPRPQELPAGAQVLPPNARNGGRGGFKYTPNARNAPQNGAPNVNGAKPLNAATLASLTPERQKRLLGEALFPLVHPQAQAQAGKVTGMLLEMDHAELLHLIENPDALRVKVSEALELLDKLIKNNGNAAPAPAAPVSN